MKKKKNYKDSEKCKRKQTTGKQSSIYFEPNEQWSRTSVMPEKKSRWKQSTG